MPDLVPLMVVGTVGLNCQKYLTPLVRSSMVALDLPDSKEPPFLLIRAVLLVPYQKSPPVGAIPMLQT